jgi:hypothetical protein
LSPADVVAIDSERQRAQRNHEDAEADERERPPDGAREVLLGEPGGVGNDGERRDEEQRACVQDDTEIDERGGNRVASAKTSRPVSASAGIVRGGSPSTRFSGNSTGISRTLIVAWSKRSSRDLTA